MNRSADTLALFDFDGTLTHSDSMLAFVRFVRGENAYWVGMLRLFPHLIFFRLGLANRRATKERFLTCFLGGMSVEELNRWGRQFAEQRIPGLLRPAGLARLRWHQEQGHQCLLVTASLSYWTQSWADSQGLSLLSTQGEEITGIFTGKLQGANCHGPEKVARVQALFPQRPGKIYAYGDSSGDRELLAWADDGQYKPFRELSAK